MPENLTFWIENTVVGFLYTLSAIFFIFHIYGIYDISLLLYNFKEYLPYIFIFVIVFCSVVGYSAQKILQFFIYTVKPKFKYEPQEEIRIAKNYPESLQKRYKYFYIVLVLFRHLIIGTILNWITILLWVDKYKLLISILFISLISILITTYFLHRQTFNEFKIILDKK